ncbi:hypothetical protein [Microbacterium sp. zg.B185]|nr:hypothetical protein [Microbacterium sp. zg.B185]MCR2809812.1 hypothetical protein [Microbacterium sp. zg.B185]
MANSIVDWGIVRKGVAAWAGRDRAPAFEEALIHARSEGRITLLA